MVKAHESCFHSQQSTWQLPDLNCMGTSLEPGQTECLPPCVNPGTRMFSTNMGLPGFAVPAKLKAEQTNGAHRLHQVLPSRFQSLVPDTYPNLNDKQSAFAFGFSGEVTPNAMFGSSQKGFLVFDQSGNQTRLIYSSASPSVMNPSAAFRKVVPGYGLHEEQAMKMDQFSPLKAIFHEESDENNISGEESEMHEDTEEINALLSSDEESDYSDYSDDDEIKSTDHSPIATEVNCEKHEHMVEISEEVASSDGPNKRQKLIYGGYKKASETDTGCSVKLEGTHEYDNDAESSSANGGTQRDEVGSILSNKRSRKDKIHKTLRILQSIIPGAKGKDPLLVLDEAIDYLQSLKLKANALGV